ncbi:S-layer homology domain-containing protein [Neobacillus sp. D3-1R]|uniref:S-layer homology domain-containing protein n=1 Tax=Neobacillus sp. D3-1R TaxID=3445778 RepID=UPI003FA03BAE
MKKSLSIVVILGIIVSFLLPTPSAFAKTSFIDVQEQFWASAEIEYLKDFQIINGYPDGSFKPNNTITRAQAAIMLKRAFQLDTSSVENPNFEDVKTTYHAYKEIAAVVEAGFIEKGEFFRPNDNLTRGEMAKILVNAYQLKGTYTQEIKDVSTDLLPYVSALAANGITDIYDDQTFKPNDPVKRAHFSVFFSRALNPNFRAEYSVLKLILPQLQFDMGVDEVKQLMKDYTLVNETELPFEFTDYQLTYSANVSGYSENEQFVLSFKNNQFHSLLINIDNRNLKNKPTAEQLDAEFTKYSTFYKAYVGSPLKVDVTTPDPIVFYSKLATYEGKYTEECKLYVQGYDFREDQEGYMTSYMFLVKKK